jgi:hypothetical protein
VTIGYSDPGPAVRAGGHFSVTLTHRSDRSALPWTQLSHGVQDVAYQSHEVRAIQIGHPQRSVEVWCHLTRDLVTINLMLWVMVEERPSEKPLSLQQFTFCSSAQSFRAARVTCYVPQIQVEVGMKVCLLISILRNPFDVSAGKRPTHFLITIFDALYQQFSGIHDLNRANGLLPMIP